MVVRLRFARRVVTTMAVAVALAAGGLSACVASPTANVGCAWRVKGSVDSLNGAFPDTNATYWGLTGYTLLPGQRFVLRGTFPYARYMSLHTYNPTGGVVDHLSDVRIVPDAGSDNPFTDPSASSDPLRRRWTVSVSPDAPASAGANGDNLISALTFGSLWLRVYVPDTGADETGGVGLPAVSVRNVDGTVTPIPQCPNPGGDPSLLALADLLPLTATASDPPVFVRPSLGVGGPVAAFPNRDNAYLSAIAAYRPGRLIVVRGRAPTTPDTQAGQSPAAPSQMRYWSLCTNEYRRPLPVTACTFDHRVPLDSSGYYTIVVSTAAERPDNATIDNGVAWLDWGNTAVPQALLFRNMLPAPGFTEAVQNVPFGQPAWPTMGDFAPIVAFCDVGDFEVGGAAACGRPTTAPTTG